MGFLRLFTSRMIALLLSAVFAESIVEIVNNNPTSTWVAIEYPRHVITTAKLQAMLGVNMEITEGPVDYVQNEYLPENFDARTQWPGKILPVRDQQQCGSCWAFAVAEVVGNRLSILGCPWGDMAPQDLVSCDKLDQGCNGGVPSFSWSHVKSTGITTEDCMPYVSGSGRVPACPAKCNNGSTIVRKKADKTSSIPAKSMEQEIFDNGPIEVAFTVYEDFKNYRSGVYQHVTGAKLGGHAVMAIGWGIQDGTPYWLVQNSWGPVWGEQGHFKILRGKNECGIEGSSYAGYFKC